MTTFLLMPTIESVDHMYSRQFGVVKYYRIIPETLGRRVNIGKDRQLGEGGEA